MNLTEYGTNVIKAEAQALFELVNKIDRDFAKAAQLILGCKGNLLIGGVGKPWFIAQKISASMASTGTPSFAIHPSDAAHGDIGRVRENDVVMLLSNSGNSEEIVRLLPILKQIGCSIISISGNADSPLAKHSTVCICYGQIIEACPLGLAPSTSSTAMLAIGDALTLSVLAARDFGPQDYAKYHPAGALGRKLMLVRKLMRTDPPSVAPDDTIWDALEAITAKRAGAVFITNKQKLCGIFTDGDLRRIMATRKEEILNSPISKFMTNNPIAIAPDCLIGDAIRLMKKNKIDELPVIGSQSRFLGYLDIQDIVGLEFPVDL